VEPTLIVDVDNSMTIVREKGSAEPFETKTIGLPDGTA
jgi:hypothetical protein